MHNEGKGEKEFSGLPLCGDSQHVKKGAVAKQGCIS